MMQLENRKKQISLPSSMQLQSHSHPNPPACTPEHSPTPHYYPSLTHGRGSVLRSSLDTPLSYYAANRARIRMGMMSASTVDPGSPMRGQSQSIQVPLSALSPPDAKPGAIGGSFNSTTKVKMVPLPTIYNRHQYTYKGVRNVCLHTNRYTPSAWNCARTFSDSLLNVRKLPTRQKKHLDHCEVGVKKSKSLKKASEVVPHRTERAFYMNGESTSLFDRQEIPPEEIRVLRTLALAQNKELYYGKGISSRAAKRANKAVQLYETRLRLASEPSKEYGLEGIDIDAGRFSRVSGAVTPGSPILEEPHHIERNLNNSQTFITQSQTKQQRQ